MMAITTPNTFLGLLWAYLFGHYKYLKYSNRSMDYQPSLLEFIVIANVRNLVGHISPAHLK